MEYTYHYHSPLGGMTLAGNGEVLTGLSFDRPENILREAPEGQTKKSLPVFTETVRWLDLYFSGRDPGFTPKLRPEGTAFARAVWEILLTIPYGRTMTYGQIAEQIAGQTGVRRMSAQAVGGAVGRNPIALIIPCHRVIGADGSLTGYAAGIDRKEKLLRMEAAE